MSSPELIPPQEEHIDGRVEEQTEELISQQVEQRSSSVSPSPDLSAGLTTAIPPSIDNVNTIQPPTTNLDPRQPSPSLPEIPADLDLSLSLDSIIGPPDPE
jgi:hypothetical protein